MRNIIIRQASINDYSVLSNLSRQLGYDVDDLTMKTRLQHILPSELNCVYVAEEEKDVIGWIHGAYNFRVESDAYVEIGGLVVDKHHRRKGVGLLLVEQVKDWAYAMKCSKLRVRTNIVRTESQIFYRSLGFEEAKTQKVFDMPLHPKR